MCKQCELRPVYEFTNQRKLCKKCFIKYFQKKFLYVNRKFGMIRKGDVVGYDSGTQGCTPKNIHKNIFTKGKDFRSVVLEDVLKMFAEKLMIELVELPEGALATSSIVGITATDASTGEQIAADVTIGGGLSGYVTPVEIDLPIASGGSTYNFVITARGFRDQSFSRTLFAGAPATIDAVLIKKPPETEATWGGGEENRDEALGGVAVITTPSGAFVTANGLWHTYPTPTKLELTPGDYTLRIEKEGYEIVEVQATVEAGQETRIEQTLIPLPVAPVWRVDVSSTPSGAKVMVNDQFAGIWTPDAVFLNEGVWKIGVVKSKYLPAAQELTLTAAAAAGA